MYVYVCVAASVFSSGCVWEVGRGAGVFTGGSGQLSPSSEQDGAMGRNKAARWGSGLIGPASARVLRPATVKSPAPVYTRELAFLRAQEEESLD